MSVPRGRNASGSWGRTVNLLSAFTLGKISDFPALRVPRRGHLCVGPGPEHRRPERFRQRTTMPPHGFAVDARAAEVRKRGVMLLVSSHRRTWPPSPVRHVWNDRGQHLATQMRTGINSERFFIAPPGSAHQVLIAKLRSVSPAIDICPAQPTPDGAECGTVTQISVSVPRHTPTASRQARFSWVGLAAWPVE